ncbi:DUF262 domain-containing protein [Flavobacterium terrigena]|uniref:Uncharacterized protein n=1 Tax=Flavobacterium terrigena TaxID=402734 RepID=A0A1H6QTC6_9FLAO|nr:DUF262 domain-containing protein [Flavobacterium terrigena]SEI42720.1 Protein of unknown function DUF262 [Flavobacterium terrigena]
MLDLTKSFKDILNLNLPLAIHKSQRPYVWDTDKVNRLIEDLEDFKKRCDKKSFNSLNYYMSTIVLFKNTEGKNQLEIIDGQQRITTLLLLDYFANGAQSILKSNPESVIFEYSSNISAQNIQKVKLFLKQDDVFNRLLSIKDIINKRLIFTVVEVETEDEAFTYFDTQNNRGKKPSIDVVLKAVHLRGIIKDEELQKECAEKWESIERFAFHGINIPGESDGFLYPFIKCFLWRSRTWKFNKASFSNDNKIENTFSRRLSSSDNNIIGFYPQNNIFNNQELQIIDGSLFYTPNPINISNLNKVENLPFQLRQPLKKGLTFFLYLEKYALIYKRLFTENENEYSEEINLFKTFYKKIYNSHSEYMKQYYMLCIMMYFDKFNEVNLLHFAYALDYLVGAERISNYYIFDVKYKNINNNYNVLDAIQMAYSPKEVIDFIVNNKEIETKKIGAINKVITTYLYDTKHYYEGGIKKQVPYRITETATDNENEITKIDLIKELNQLVEKRKSWLLNKINT